MTNKLQSIVIWVFCIFSLATCSGGRSGASGASAAVSQTVWITATGYLNRGSHFDLYLKNTSDAPLQLSSASFISDTNTDNAFALYGWQVGDDSEILSDTFTGATLAPGVAITFTIKFFPLAMKSHTATFQVFYGETNPSVIDYDITGNVVKGEPPTTQGDGDDTDDGDDGEEDPDDGGDDDSPPPASDTPAAELSGEKTLKITKMYAFIAKNSPVVGENSAKLDIAFDEAGGAFTFYKVGEDDGFQIPTAEGGTFSGQAFVVTTSADANGSFSSELITVENLTLALLAKGVKSPVGSDAQEFGFSATIGTFSTGEIPIPGDLSEEDVTSMKAGFNTDHDYAGNASLTGVYPSGGNRDIALVGCGKIPFSSVKAGSAGKSAFSNPDTTLCAIIEGQVIEK